MATTIVSKDPTTLRPYFITAHDYTRCHWGGYKYWVLHGPNARVARQRSSALYSGGPRSAFAKNLAAAIKRCERMNDKYEIELLLAVRSPHWHIVSLPAWPEYAEYLGQQMAGHNVTWV